MKQERCRRQAQALPRVTRIEGLAPDGAKREAQSHHGTHHPGQDTSDGPVCTAFREERYNDTVPTKATSVIFSIEKKNPIIRSGKIPSRQ